MKDSLKEVDERIKHKLNEGIEPISQETADELIKQMEEWNKAIVRTQLAIQFVSYMKKYSNATFTTRWYWKRKMQNFIKGIKDLKQITSYVTE